nr:hypothetical protein [Actinomycetota bacterium]
MSRAKEAVARGLLEQYAPVLRFHESEPLRADSPAIMSDAVLEGGWGARLVDGEGTVLASAAPTAGTDVLSLDYLGDPYADGGDAEGSHRIVTAAEKPDRVADMMRSSRPELADRVFAQAVQEGKKGRVWLQYWLFYYFNDKGIEGIGDHEGDWEMVQIGLDSEYRPECAAFAQHKYGERREWDDVRKLDDDEGPPIVWVALGSHASYFRPGHYRIKGAPAIDHATGDERIEVRPAVERLDESVRWLRWPGRWGAEGGPDGPLQHRQYLKPDSWYRSKSVHTERRWRWGKLYLAAPAARPPEPRRLTARQVEGAVEVEWELEPLRPRDPNVPVRAVVS